MDKRRRRGLGASPWMRKCDCKQRSQNEKPLVDVAGMIVLHFNLVRMESLVTTRAMMAYRNKTETQPTQPL